MEYEKKDGKVIGKLKQKNVDTGAGLERLAMVLQKKNKIFENNFFSGLIRKISELSAVSDIRAKRIVADHIRTAVFIISDGVVASNTDRGYILRRIVRRAVRYSDMLGIEKGFLAMFADTIIEKYKDMYPNLLQKSAAIKEEINKEEEKFRETLQKGLKELKKLFPIEPEIGRASCRERV